MARKPQVNYWPSRGGYGCWHKGRQEILAAGPDDAPTGPTYLAALERFREILSLSAALHAGDRAALQAVLEHYLRHLAGKKQFSTLKIRQRFYQDVIEGLPAGIQVGKLRHVDLYQFFARMREDSGRRLRSRRKCRWTDGSVSLCCDSLQAALNWAAKSGLISRNPLAGLERPGSRSRGAACLFTEDEHERILAHVSASFRRLVVALENTGARPGELSHARANDFDVEAGLIRYHRASKKEPGQYSHKTGRKNRDRVIRFTGAALDMVRALYEEAKDGNLYLFRPSATRHRSNANGRWLDREIEARFRAVRRKLGLSRELTSYSYRHAFATRMLKRGMPVEVLADVMGTSPKMIREHYSHVAENESFMREQLEKFSGASGTGSRSGSGPDVSPFAAG